MKSSLIPGIVFVFLSSVGFAQSDCEAQRPEGPPDATASTGSQGSSTDAGLPSVQLEGASASKARSFAEERRPSNESFPEGGGRRAGAIPEVLNGTFRPTSSWPDEPDLGVMASVCEEIGDWKGAAEGYERVGNWAKAAENWEKLGRDLDGLGLRAEADSVYAKADDSMVRAGGRPVAHRRPTAKRAKEGKGGKAGGAMKKPGEETRERGVKDVHDAIAGGGGWRIRVVRLVRGAVRLVQAYAEEKAVR